jgi:hypothetical protein
MFKDELVKVELTTVKVGDKAGDHALSIRLDFKMRTKQYGMIHVELAELAERMIASNSETRPQLHWHYETLPCTIVVGPNRDAVEGKPNNTCIDLGTIQFDKKLMLITRKDRQEDSEPELFLYATTKLGLNKKNLDFVRNYFKVPAWCRIRTPQQVMSTPPDNEEGDKLE